MIDYSRELKEQKQEVDRLVQKTKKHKKAFEGLAEGNIRVSASNGCPQYYFTEKGSGHEKYIPSKDKEFTRRLVQRDYEEKALRKLESMQHDMDRFLKKCDAKILDHLYDNLCDGRKILVTPLSLPDDEYVKRWLESFPGEQNPYPEQGKYETDQGEIVRSKSEKILADMFHKLKIPYRYEPKVTLDNYKSFYPDFACLNVRKRKTVYWEHLGLVSDADYATKNYAKLESYERNGILLGDTLLVSMETAQNPLDLALIRKKIETFLK